MERKKSGSVPFKTDDDVRAYVRKRKRANKNCSVSHLRRALNIGYKKAKRIHDEVDEELRRERLEGKPSKGSDVKSDEPDDDEEEEEEEEKVGVSNKNKRAKMDHKGDGSVRSQDGEDDTDISDEAIREHLRKKLRRGEVIYVNQLRELGIAYKRARRIVQEFVDQGKIQKLPKGMCSPIIHSNNCLFVCLFK